MSHILTIFRRLLCRHRWDYLGCGYVGWIIDWCPKCGKVRVRET